MSEIKNYSFKATRQAPPEGVEFSMNKFMHKLKGNLMWQVTKIMEREGEFHYEWEEDKCTVTFNFSVEKKE